MDSTLKSMVGGLRGILGLRENAETRSDDWKQMVIAPDEVLDRIEPGMSIFLGTGAAEPRTLVKHLMAADRSNLTDLELIQLVSFGDAISLEALNSQKYRLKTFFSGWIASEAITGGRVDLIPSRFSNIPGLIQSGKINIDVAFVQVTPPSPSGYCSLGIGVDVARRAIEQADLVVGEINTSVPVTYGDTFVHVSEFDALVEGTEPPFHFCRWPVDKTFDRVAANVASVIEDGSCIAFSIGSLFEALGRQLTKKKHLGIHSPFITDPVMDLIKSGAVTNRRKGISRGRSLVSYAVGSPELMSWLDHNPLVEFQGIEQVFSPARIACNNHFVAVVHARKVDITGGIALHTGRGNVAHGPAEAVDFVNGAEMSRGGLIVIALPSRNLEGKSNILISLGDIPNQFGSRESVDMVVTDYGVASLRGRSSRERAQALIEVAHPDDREELVAGAKEMRILYPDQIFLKESGELYPSEIAAIHTFKGGIQARFRAIKPSDEEGMRRLFYRFSDETVYYRYFSPIKTMPHSKMQEYVNVDFSQALSIVGLVGNPGSGRIIAEGRCVRRPDRPYGDAAFVVDEEFQGLGIASFIFRMLAQFARERGLKGLTADVLVSNRAMMKVVEKSGLPVKVRVEAGVYKVTIPFETENGPTRRGEPSGVADHPGRHSQRPSHGWSASLTRQAPMLSESQKHTMCVSQELQEREPLCGEHDGNADKAFVSLLPTSPTCTDSGWNSEFHRPQETGEGDISHTSQREVSIGRAIEDKERNQHKPDWSKLRDRELESAVHRIITGVERTQLGDL